MLAIEPDTEGVTIRLAGGNVRVRRVVVAAGPWLPQLVPGLPITPHRVVMTWFAARDDRDASVERMPVFIRSVPGSAGPGGTGSAGTGSAGTGSAGTDSAGTGSAGTDSADTDSASTGHWIWGHGALAGDLAKVGPEFDGPFEADDPDAIDREIHAGETDGIRDLVAATFPDLEPEPAEATTCIMAHTPDGQFVVGRLARVGGRDESGAASAAASAGASAGASAEAAGSDAAARVVVAGGCSGHSFKHASALGELAAQLAVDEEPFTEIGFLDPGRFR